MLLVANDRCLDHVAGRNHPERPARLGAVHDGLAAAGLADALIAVEAVPAELESIVLVHDQAMVDLIHEVDEAGGGRLDADTVMNDASLEAALLAAGAGLEAVRRIDEGEARSAFCAVRPPGHHATQRQAMGFCLLNNVAVTASALAERGERVLIVDYDVHHGNGTQDIFYADDRVMFISFHQFPAYPGTGRLDETGSGAGVGSTMNFPLPPGTTGDVYRRAWDQVAAPAVDTFDPTWLLLSAGFDAHRDDPLSDMGLAAGDYADLTSDISGTTGAVPTIAFLEGGYGLDGLAKGSAAAVAALLGEDHRPEPSTSGGPGGSVVDAALALQTLAPRNP